MENYSKFIQFLKALEAGLEVEIDDKIYVGGYDRYGFMKIAHKMESYNTETEEKKFVYIEGLDLPDINNFITYITKNVSDEQLTEINANIALNKIKNERT